MRLYIIRHADPDYERGTITPDGHLEAQALADRLMEHGLDRIYCSPMGRAIHTMQYTTDRLRMQAIIVDWMQEINGMNVTVGEWGSMSPFELPGEVILEKEPFPGHHNWHENPFLSDGRLQAKVKEIQESSDAFLSSLGYEREGGRYRCVRPNEEQVAVFCHGGLGLTWLAHLLQLPTSLAWSAFWLAPSSVTTILMDRRSDEWAVPRCIGLGDTSHLHKAGLPIKPRGILANYY
ncbi:histidine phosphatase family protein [Paenibacillus sp. GD4]|jgi:broad specificity phosphatase PhoE|uniref:histidine phosphatase family protein n=1 Tax=Paenibacillus sp. GD4 TaxID=3068890 RepID=UPI002796466D|nr:histidine phosphatase family protein [Paenibacillus sp. GD4]MDQ1909018.1 histidine phosphatase family protein [Paenibacillus sp. GD4]